jgi:serine/threonine protein kinase
MRPCPSENELLEFLEGALDAGAAQQVEQHVAGCELCRVLLSTLGRLAAPAEGEAASTEREAAPREDHLGQVLKETYRIEAVIGRGGMGVVYRASHLRLERTFAVKVLSRAVADRSPMLARFRREALITSRIAHPHIVEVTDFDFMGDRSPYLVMELLDGEDLATRLRRRRGQLPPLELTVSVLCQAASALNAAHRHGVVHRDIKPSNIFLCRWGARDDFVKLLDFGISKVVGEASEITTSRDLLGSPGYLAPEQVDPSLGKVDACTDAYSLAAVAYRMLTGRPPFARSTMPEMLYAVVNAPLRPLSLARSDLPDELTREIDRALSKQPSDRPTVGDLARQLAASVGQPELADCTEIERAQLPAGGGWTPVGEMVVPSPDTLETVTNRPARRLTRRAALVHVAALVAGLTGLAGMLWLVGRSPSVMTSSDLRVGDAGVHWRDARRDVSASLDAQLAHPEAAAGPRAADRRRPRRQTKRSPHRRSRLARGQGSLVIQSTSASDGRYLWADVFLDGKRVGQTTLKLKAVASGAHHVRLSRPGYRSVERRVRLRPGQELQLSFELEPRP